MIDIELRDKRTIIGISAIAFTLMCIILGIAGKLDDLFSLFMGFSIIVGGGIAVMIPILLGLGLYILPILVAIKRNHSNKVPVIMVSICFGWTILGWIVALIWAFTDNTENN